MSRWTPVKVLRGETEHEKLVVGAFLTLGGVMQRPVARMKTASRATPLPRDTLDGPRTGACDPREPAYDILEGR